MSDHSLKASQVQVNQTLLLKVSDIERNQMKKRGRNIKRKQILAKDPLYHDLISAIMLIGLKELADHISVPIKMFPPLRKCKEQHNRREHHKILK